MKFAIPILAGLICAGYVHPAYTPSQTARGRVSALRAHLTEQRSVQGISTAVSYTAPRAPNGATTIRLTLSFACIHSHEGAWTANTGNGYEGGLQFGHSEWRRFGGRYAAHAYEATPVEQISAAIAYWRVAGFAPWPATRRMCGV